MMIVFPLLFRDFFFKCLHAAAGRVRTWHIRHAWRRIPLERLPEARAPIDGRTSRNASPIRLPRVPQVRYPTGLKYWNYNVLFLRFHARAGPQGRRALAISHSGYESSYAAQARLDANRPRPRP